jgi:hypothetical protein
MEITGEWRRRFMPTSVEGKLSTLTSPEFQRRLASWMDQGIWSPLVDLPRPAAIHSAGPRSIPVGSGELKHVHGNIGVREVPDSILCVLPLRLRSSMTPGCASIHEALPQSQR